MCRLYSLSRRRHLKVIYTLFQQQQTYLLRPGPGAAVRSYLLMNGISPVKTVKKNMKETGCGVKLSPPGPPQSLRKKKKGYVFSHISVRFIALASATRLYTYHEQRKLFVSFWKSLALALACLSGDSFARNKPSDARKLGMSSLELEVYIHVLMENPRCEKLVYIPTYYTLYLCIYAIGR